MDLTFQCSLFSWNATFLVLSYLRGFYLSTLSNLHNNARYILHHSQHHCRQLDSSALNILGWTLVCLRLILPLNASINSGRSFRAQFVGEIFFEPTTTSCGHSFCRKCLQSAIDDKFIQRCPICRKMISNGGSYTVSTVLWSTIHRFFPQDVGVRKAVGALNSRQPHNLNLETEDNRRNLSAQPNGASTRGLSSRGSESMQSHGGASSRCLSSRRNERPNQNQDYWNALGRIVRREIDGQRHQGTTEILTGRSLFRLRNQSTQQYRASITVEPEEFFYFDLHFVFYLVVMAFAMMLFVWVILLH